jgi:hypothetical protein
VSEANRTGAPATAALASAGVRSLTEQSGCKGRALEGALLGGGVFGLTLVFDIALYGGDRLATDPERVATFPRGMDLVPEVGFLRRSQDD